MSAAEGYQRIHRVIQSSVDRLALYVTGVITQKHARPAQVAKGIAKLPVREA